jgi:hypothetical protein
MWPVAILLIAVVEFYWFAFMGTIWCWLQTLSCLLQGKFIRAAIWFSLGLGGLWWWMETEGVDFDKWLHASYGIVGLGATVTLLRYLNRIIPPRKKLFKPRSPTGSGYKTAANDNQLISISLSVKECDNTLATGFFLRQIRRDDGFSKTTMGMTDK